MKATSLVAVLNKDSRFSEIQILRDDYRKVVKFQFLGKYYAVTYTGFGLDMKVSPRYQYLLGILYDIVSEGAEIRIDSKDVVSGKYRVLDSIDEGSYAVFMIEDTKGVISILKVNKTNELFKELSGHVKPSKSLVDKLILRTLSGENPESLIREIGICGGDNNG